MKFRFTWIAGWLAAVQVGAAEPAKPTAPAPAQNEVTAEDLFEAGQQLFDALAPPEVKEHFEFPDRQQWLTFATRLQAALEGSDPSLLAEFEPEAQAALQALRQLPGSEEYIDWLEERLDYIQAAKQMPAQPPPKPPSVLPGQFIPEYDLWLKRVRGRPSPATASKYVEMLRPIFVSAGVPGELVWLAEVESSFNPVARSPVGARGLFQLMPATAEELGLQTFLPDERTNPTKSAQAAAKMLRNLHQRFGDWPLALAAYNAGPGRVRRTLAKEKAKTFAEISAALPLETRLYVPKVLATLKVRTGVSLTQYARKAEGHASVATKNNAGE